MLDYKGGTLPDLLLVRYDSKDEGSTSNRLYENNGGWTFTDVTDDVGLGRESLSTDRGR